MKLYQHAINYTSPTALLTFFLFLLCVSWSLVSLTFPFGWDQGMLASVADVILRGGLPYRDGWEMKGPLTYYIFALARWVFGPNTWGIRVFDIIMLFGASISLFYIVSKWTLRYIGILASFSYILWYSSFTWFHTSQPDGWVAMLLTIGFVPLLIKIKPSVCDLIVASFCVGLSGLIKPLFLLFGIVPIMAVPIYENRLVTVFLNAFLIGFSALAPILVFYLYFYLSGGIDAFYDVHIIYTLYAYSGSQPLTTLESISKLIEWFLSGKAAVLIPCVIYGAYRLYKIQGKPAILLITWLFISITCVVIQSKYYIYHWHPVIPPLIISSAIGLSGLSMLTNSDFASYKGALRANSGVLIAWITFTIFLFQIAFTPTYRVFKWVQYQSGLRSEDSYYKDFVKGGYVALDDIRAANYLRTQTQPSDKLVVFGIDAVLNYLSDRSSPSRFMHSMPLTRSKEPWRSAYRKEFIFDITSDPPKYIAIGQPYTSITKDKALSDFPEFASYLSTRYRLEKSFGIIDLYRRNINGIGLRETDLYLLP